MKRYIYTIIALASVAIGCTKSNVVDVPVAQKTPITFETYNGRIPVTKATEVTQTIFESSSQQAPAFKVKAFKEDGSSYMDKDVWCQTPSSTQGTTTTPAAWKYEGLKYWPNDGSNLSFVAYGLNASDKMTPTTTGEGENAVISETEFVYSVGAKASEHRDLVVAEARPDVNPTSDAIQLTFKHVLSKVGFQLKTSVANEKVNVTIKSLKLHGNFFATGNVDLTSATPVVSTEGLTAVETSYSLFDTDYELGAAAGTFDFFTIPSPGQTPARVFANSEVDLATNVASSLTDNTDCYMMIIPSDDPNPSVEVIYEIQGGKEESKKVSLEDSSFKFEAGKAYEFILEISTSAMEFDAEVVPWEEVTPDIPLN